MHRTFTLHTEEPDGEVAKLEADTVPSNFTPLGEATNAVVMRLNSKLPRIKVKRLRGLHGEENTEPSR